MSQRPLIVAALCLALPVLAQAQAVYPAKGQSAAQQQKDTSECQAWAAGQASGAPPQQGAPVARGAARGAVGGAAIGAIADGDTGKAAAAGAVIGGARAGRQQSQAKAAAQQQNTNAFAACMQGRGYSVK